MHKHIHIYVHKHIHKHTKTHIHTGTHMFTRRVQVSPLHLHMYSYAYQHTHTHTHTCGHVQDPTVHGLVVQLPLPPHMREELVVSAVSPVKDAEGATTSMNDSKYASSR